jgi:hypothetical protein
VCMARCGTSMGSRIKTRQLVVRAECKCYELCTTKMLRLQVWSQIYKSHSFTIITNLISASQAVLTVIGGMSRIVSAAPSLAIVSPDGHQIAGAMTACALLCKPAMCVLQCPFCTTLSANTTALNHACCVRGLGAYSNWRACAMLANPEPEDDKVKASQWRISEKFTHASQRRCRNCQRGPGAAFAELCKVRQDIGV